MKSWELDANGANYWSAFRFASIRAIRVFFLSVIRVIRAIRG
jgi:hypothetical protein